MAARRRGLGDVTRAVRDTAGYLGLPVRPDSRQQASLVEVALGSSEMKDAAEELRTGGLRRRSVQVRLGPWALSRCGWCGCSLPAGSSIA